MKYVDDSIDPVKWQQQAQLFQSAAVAELFEFLETTHWKQWRSNFSAPLTEDERREAQLELIDAFCFIVNLWFLTGGSPEDFYAMHAAKCIENIRRQKAGY